MVCNFLDLFFAFHGLVPVFFAFSCLVFAEGFGEGVGVLFVDVASFFVVDVVVEVGSFFFEEVEDRP